MLKSGGAQSGATSPSGGPFLSNTSSTGFPGSNLVSTAKKFSSQTMTTLPYEQRA